MTEERNNSADMSEPNFGWYRLKQHWMVACAAAELRGKPIQRTVLGESLVLFRGTDGVAALRDQCPHRNAPLSAGRVVNGCVQCPYHGWQFGGDGACSYRPGIPNVTAPAPQVQPFHVVEANGLVWVRLKHGRGDVPVERQWSQNTDFESFLWIDSVQSSFVDALENLLDATHTPFVHSGLVRSEGNRQTLSAIVRVSDGVAEAEYIDEGKQAGWISRLFERNRRSSFGRFVPPALAELEYTSTRGTEFVLNSWFTPETVDRLRVYSRVYLRRSWIPLFAKQAVISPMFRRVLQQDQRILELQQHNIREQGKDFHSWDGDVLRGWMETWLRTGQLADTMEQRINFEL